MITNNKPQRLKDGIGLGLEISVMVFIATINNISKDDIDCFD